jgi:hypothetical protein
MRFAISLLLVAAVAIILAQVEVDPGPSIKIKRTKSAAQQVATKFAEDVEQSLLRGFEWSIGASPGSVKDVSIQASRSNLPLKFRSMHQGRWVIRSAKRVFVGMFMVIIILKMNDKKCLIIVIDCKFSVSIDGKKFHGLFLQES